MKWNKPEADVDNPKDIVERICRYKLDDIENPDPDYIWLKSRWSDKVGVYEELEKASMPELCLPCEWRGYAKTFDASILGKIIADRETKAKAEKEQELLDRTPNPDGNGGGSDDGKTSAEKLVSKMFGGEKQETNILSHYI